MVDRLFEARKYLSSNTGKVSFFFLLSAQFNPLYTNGFLLLVCYDKPGIVRCTYLGPGCQVLIKNIVFCSLKISSTLINSVDADEIQHYASFHLSLHSLQEYSFRGFPNTKGIKNPYPDCFKRLLHKFKCTSENI